MEWRRINKKQEGLLSENQPEELLSWIFILFLLFGVLLIPSNKICCTTEVRSLMVDFSILWLIVKVLKEVRKIFNYRNIYKKYIFDE